MRSRQNHPARCLRTLDGQWLDAVADSSSTMSQRKLSSVQKRGGGIEAVKAIAQANGVHLLILQDDKGNALVAASAHPFKVVC